MHNTKHLCFRMMISGFDITCVLEITVIGAIVMNGSLVSSFLFVMVQRARETREAIEVLNKG